MKRARRDRSPGAAWFPAGGSADLVLVLVLVLVLDLSGSKWHAGCSIGRMPLSIGIVGAGAIGGYLAAALSAGGADVLIFERLAQFRIAPRAVRADGTRLEGARVRFVESTSDLAAADVCIAAVKSSDTEALAADLAGSLGPHVPVVSFQNGLSNIERLQGKLGARAVAGVVTFNVFVDGSGVRHQANSGYLLSGDRRGAHGDRLRDLAAAFAASGERLELRDDIDAVLLGKLLVNLNNGICAATGLGIAECLRDRDARWCYAQCIREGLRAMRAVGLEPARVTALSAENLARAMLLPDFVVARMAAKVASMSASARSSTLQDLDRGRPTEIDDLNGAIATIAARAARTAPLNELVTEIVHEHEASIRAGRAPSFISARELRGRFERRMVAPRSTGRIPCSWSPV